MLTMIDCTRNCTMQEKHIAFDTHNMVPYARIDKRESGFAVLYAESNGHFLRPSNDRYPTKEAAFAVTLATFEHENNTP